MQFLYYKIPSNFKTNREIFTFNRKINQQCSSIKFKLNFFLTLPHLNNTIWTGSTTTLLISRWPPNTTMTGYLTCTCRPTCTCHTSNVILALFGLNTVVVFDGYESSNSTKAVEQQRRASKGVPVCIDFLCDEQIKAISTQVSFLANATNKSQLIAMIFTKFQHHGMPLNRLKPWKLHKGAGDEFLLKFYCARTVQTPLQCYHPYIHRSSLSPSFKLEFLPPTRAAER